MPDQLVQFSLLAGLDGKKDQRTMPLGALQTAQNMVYDRMGAAEKRPGNVSQGNAVVAPSNHAYGGALPATIPTPVSPCGMFGLGNEQVLAVGARIYCQSPTLGDHVSKDEIPEGVGTRRSLSSGGNSQFYCPDVCQTSNGFRVYAWMNATAGGSAYCRIYDAATNALVWSAMSQLQGVISCVKLVACGTYAVAVFMSTVGNVTAVLINPAAIATGGTVVGAPTTIGTSNVTYLAMDACAAQGGASFFCAYQQTTAGLILQQINVPALTNNTSTVPSASVGFTQIKSVAVCDNAGTVWVACSNTNTGVINIYGALDSSPGATAFAYSLSSPFPANAGIRQMGIAPYTSSQCVIACGGVPFVGSYNALLSTSGLVSYSYAGANYGINFGNSATLGNQLLFLASKPTTYNGRCYALLYYMSPTQGTYFWCDLECTPGAVSGSPRAVATIAPRLANSIIINAFTPSNLVNDGAGNLYAPCSVLEGGGLVARQGNALVAVNKLWETKLNFMHPGRYLGGNAGHSAIVGSSFYDGASVTELGFLTYPEAFTGAQQNGGALTANSTYQYMVLYEWTSSSGETIRSTACVSAGAQALSVALTGANQSVALSWELPPLTSKIDAENTLTPPVVSVYRTQANGTTFNFVASFPFATPFGTTDAASDASIAGNPELYFDPGFQGTVLDYVCPPSSSHTITTQGRPWVLGDDLRTVWFGNVTVEGIQSQFNEGLTLAIQDAGDLTALGFVDDKIVFFSADRIYYTYGAGPSPTGSGDFYPTPVRVQSDVGCIDPRSVVTIPDGVMFLSAQGWVVLGRDLSVNFISEPNDVWQNFPNVTSAVLFPERHEVRVALNNGSTGCDLVASYWAPTGQTQTYKYRWSVFLKLDPVASVTPCESYAAAHVNGTYRWLSSAGNPFTEDASGTCYFDCVSLGSATAANWVTQWAETSFLNANGPIGWQRTKRVSAIGDWFSSHDAYLGVATDFVESYASAAGSFGPLPQGQTDHFVSNTIDSAQWEQVRTIVMNQKNQAIRLSIYDAPPTSSGATLGSGRGFSLAGFGVLLTPKQGVGKLLASNRQG